MKEKRKIRVLIGTHRHDEYGFEQYWEYRLVPLNERILIAGKKNPICCVEVCGLFAFPTTQVPQMPCCSTENEALCWIREHQGEEVKL